MEIQAKQPCHHIRKGLLASQIDLLDRERFHEVLSLRIVIWIARRAHRAAQPSRLQGRPLGLAAYWEP